MADYDINLKLNVDAQEAEALKALPQEARRQWEELNREIAKGKPALTGAAGELHKRSQRMEQISGATEARGFFTPQQRREFDRALSQLNRLFKEYYDERVKIAEGRRL